MNKQFDSIIDPDDVIFHWAANALPSMSEGEFQELKSNIKEHGQLEAILITSDGRAIDGRHRVKACAELGLQVKARNYEGSDESILEFVVWLNLKRRPLNDCQRTMVAARLTDLIVRRPPNTRQNSGVSLDEAASTLRVATCFVEEAAKVGSDGVEELVSAVVAGDIPRSVASEIASLPPEEQLDIMACGERAILRITRESSFQKTDAYRDALSHRKYSVPEDLPPITARYELHNRDMTQATEFIEPGTVDAIVTEPPSPRNHLALYKELAVFAAHSLVKGGRLIVLCGQAFMPEIIAVMTPHIKYQWTVAYYMPGDDLPLPHKRFRSRWKPGLVFAKGTYRGDFHTDILPSEHEQKRHHEYEQSQSGCLQLVDRFSDPGQVVLDPFMGSGTAGVVAVKNHRRFIGIEIDPRAYSTAFSRLSELKERDGYGAV